MTTGGWICLLAPLTGALLITLAGTRISRGLAGWVSTLSVVVAFAGALVALIDMLGQSASHRAASSTASSSASFPSATCSTRCRSARPISTGRCSNS